MIDIIDESEIQDTRGKGRKTNVCYGCGISFENSIESPLKECNEYHKWTGRWDCRKCWGKYDPNSTNNIRKLLRDHRAGNLRNLEHIKGDLFQELTCRYRSTVSIILVEDLNKKLDNYTSQIDHTPDSELGIIQTKGKLFNRLSSGAYGGWLFGNFKGEWHKEYDHAICYCASEDGKGIERIYIFSSWEIIGRLTINIVKNPSRHIPWYEKYRITEEETLNKVNQIWKQILEERNIHEL